MCVCGGGGGDPCSSNNNVFFVVRDVPKPQDEDLPQSFKDTFELKRTMFAPVFGKTVGPKGPSDDIV